MDVFFMGFEGAESPLLYEREIRAEEALRNFWSMVSV
jgi:hypothetical protein